MGKSGQFRCGWPFRMPRSSTIVYCGLPLGHAGPYCKFLSSEGKTLSIAPRFGVTPLTDHDDRG